MLKENKVKKERKKKMLNKVKKERIANQFKKRK